MVSIMEAQNEVRVVNVQLVREPSLYSETKIQTPEDALKVIAGELAKYDREVFAFLNLKTNGQPINLNICSVGTLNASLVSPREVFKSSILSNANNFICLHNHPGAGHAELAPSQDDIEVTERLIECGKLLDINMVDHIIVAGETGEMYSFRQEGMLERLGRKVTDLSR